MYLNAILLSANISDHKHLTTPVAFRERYAIVPTIRPEQMEVFEEAGQRRLTEKAMALMRELWPAKCAGLSDEELEARVTSGIVAARGFDILSDREICRYLNVLFTFSEFPTPKSHSWTIEILSDVELLSEQKIDRLWIELKERMLSARAT